MGLAIFIGEQRSGLLDAGTPTCGTAGASERAAGGGAEEGEGAHCQPLGCLPAISPARQLGSPPLPLSPRQRAAWVEEGVGQRGVQTSASRRMSERAAAAGSRICILR